MKKQLEPNGSVIINNDWVDGEIVEIQFNSKCDSYIALISDNNAQSIWDDINKYNENTDEVLLANGRIYSGVIVVKNGNRHILIINNASENNLVQLNFHRSKSLPKYFGGTSSFPTSATGI